MENPSLRVIKHNVSTSRTFIAEDLIEDEFGQWATDKATGEQGYVGDEGSCFWTWDNNTYAWQSRPSRIRKFKKRNKGKGKNKVGSTGTGRSFLGEEHAQGSTSWSEKDCVWWSKRKRATKASTFLKGNAGFRKGGVRTGRSEHGSSNFFINTKAKAKIKKEEAREVPFHRQDFQLLKIPLNRRQGHPWESDDRTIPLVQLEEAILRGFIQEQRLGWHQFLGSCPPSDARCSGSWLHTINWIENCKQKVPKICVLLWSYDRILSLQ